jgi:hypothetical protein
MSPLLTTIITKFKSRRIASAGAIPAINVKDGTINFVGGDQINNTTIYNVDSNCNQGICTHQFCDLGLIIGPDKIYQWLSAVIPSMNYHGALRARLENTGLWFINGSRFARWKAQADDFFGSTAHVCIPIICESSFILNYCGSWYRKDRLEVNRHMIALF